MQVLPFAAPSAPSAAAPAVDRPAFAAGDGTRSFASLLGAEPVSGPGARNAPGTEAEPSPESEETIPSDPAESSPLHPSPDCFVVPAAPLLPVPTLPALAPALNANAGTEQSAAPAHVAPAVVPVSNEASSAAAAEPTTPSPTGSAPRLAAPLPTGKNAPSQPSAELTAADSAQTASPAGEMPSALVSPTNDGRVLAASGSTVQPLADVARQKGAGKVVNNPVPMAPAEPDPAGTPAGGRAQELRPVPAGHPAERAAPPSSNPITAAPTLTQVLVENAAGNPTARGPKTADVAAPLRATSGATPPPNGAQPVSAATVPPGAATEAILPPGANAPADAAEDASKGRAESAPRGTAPSTAAEKLAATLGKAPRSAAPESAAARGRNFLSVERQRVGAEDGGFGMSIANQTQTMAAHTPVLPTPPSALDVLEPAVGLVSGNAAAVASPKAGPESLVPRSFAAEVVQQTLDTAERAQAAGRNHLELRLESSGQENLRVHLHWHDGVVHAKFVTSNADLQQALSREWDRAVPQFADKGLRLGEASFERHDHSSSGQSSAQNAFTSDHQRHAPHGQRETFDRGDQQTSARPTAPAQPATASRRTGSAAASTAAAVLPNPAESRSLRAWA